MQKMANRYPQMLLGESFQGCNQNILIQRPQKLFICHFEDFNKKNFLRHIFQKNLQNLLKIRFSSI